MSRKIGSLVIILLLVLIVMLLISQVQQRTGSPAPETPLPSRFHRLGHGRGSEKQSDPGGVAGG